MRTNQHLRLLVLFASSAALWLLLSRTALADDDLACPRLDSGIMRCHGIGTTNTGSPFLGARTWYSEYIEITPHVFNNGDGNRGFGAEILWVVFDDGSSIEVGYRAVCTSPTSATPLPTIREFRPRGIRACDYETSSNVRRDWYAQEHKVAGQVSEDKILAPASGATGHYSFVLLSRDEDGNTWAANISGRRGDGSAGWVGSWLDFPGFHDSSPDRIDIGIELTNKYFPVATQIAIDVPYGEIHKTEKITDPWFEGATWSNWDVVGNDHVVPAQFAWDTSGQDACVATRYITMTDCD